MSLAVHIVAGALMAALTVVLVAAALVYAATSWRDH